VVDLNAGKISIKYPDNNFPGHSAWLDWPYKLHRINTNGDDIKFELYNLETDPGETTDLYDKNPEISATIKMELETWLGSVINSLNGNDYKGKLPTIGAVILTSH